MANEKNKVVTKGNPTANAVKATSTTPTKPVVTASVVTPVATTPPVVIRKRIMYVNNADKILADTKEKDKLKSWSIAKKLTGFKWYDTGTIFSDTKLMKSLNDMINDLRMNTTVQDHQATRSGSKRVNGTPFGDSKVTAYDASHSLTGRFFNGSALSGIDLEYEFYLDKNENGTKRTPAEQKAMFEEWRKSAESYRNFANAKSGIATSYLGHLKPDDNVNYEADTVVKNLHRLDLSIYIDDINEGKMLKWAVLRLQQVSAAQKRFNPNLKFKWYPIFSLEPDYLDQVAKKKTFDEIFTDLINQYRADKDIDKTYLQEPDGYVLFDYTFALAARPSLTTA